MEQESEGMTADDHMRYRKIENKLVELIEALCGPRYPYKEQYLVEIAETIRKKYNIGPGEPAYKIAICLMVYRLLIKKLREKEVVD